MFFLQKRQLFEFHKCEIRSFKKQFTYLLKFSSLIKKGSGFAILMPLYVVFYLFDAAVVRALFF